MARQKYSNLKIALSAFTTLTLVVLLSRSWGEFPAMGNLLEPFHGCWQNAENKSDFWEDTDQLPYLKEPVKVLYDDNRTPHIFAQNEADLYYVQGYITARDRLWQMELQTHAAAGRVSEILGAKAIPFDKKQRRKGMVLAAQRSLVEINKEPVTKQMIDNYAFGVNAYINSITAKTLPLEYKLLNYQPEPWTNLKTALLLKLMADDLSGYSNDVAYTNALQTFGQLTFDKLYPDFPSYISPIIPTETTFDFKGDKNDTSSVLPTSTIIASLLSNKKKQNDPLPNKVDWSTKPEMPVGSNNWAVSGSKTRSGYPILCGDPHLKLSLPSIWYEIQLSVKGKSGRGASLPGAPGVIIGFNDSCAWSMTNAERDVRDFYKITFKDASQKEYWIDGAWQPTPFQIETLKVKNSSEIYDTVYSTKFGLVVYDKGFKEAGMPNNTAISWTAQLPSNELATIYLLDKANNYNDYKIALSWYQSPAQNFVFACKNKDIAIWEQGRFPIKFKNQGKFVQEGNSSKILWGKFIPFEENPHILNPDRGFVSSANQQPTDSTYPYYYYGDYYEYRSLRINEELSKQSRISIASMKRLQQDDWNYWVADFKTQIQCLFPNASLGNTIFQLPNQSDFTDHLFRKWNLKNTASNPYTVFYRIWYDELTHLVFDDEFTKAKIRIDLPNRDVFIKSLMLDSTFVLTDNITTAKQETMQELVLESFKRTRIAYDSLKQKNLTGWAQFRHTVIAHLAKLDAFSVPVFGNGEGNSINAVTSDHGPSWRMVVELTPETEAYGIFPGGASGNPGSYYYDNRIKTWEQGEYDHLKIFKISDDQKALAVQYFKK